MIGDVATDRGRAMPDGHGLAERVWEAAARRRATASPGIADDDVHAHRKMTKLWGREAGRATQVDRILVLAATEAGRRRATCARQPAGRLDLAAAAPPRALSLRSPSQRGRRSRLRRLLASRVVKQMYHPSDLAAMDPLVLMKNLDHVRMTSRRLSYILQQQVHLYTPEANQLREQIDGYVEAERQIEGEMARRRIRA